MILGSKIGRTILFFGCRHEHKDFLYSEELKCFENLGFIELHTAFSRDDIGKFYIQDLLKANEEMIWSLLDRRNAHFYVCGYDNYNLQIFFILYDIEMAKIKLYPN